MSAHIFHLITYSVHDTETENTAGFNEKWPEAIKELPWFITIFKNVNVLLNNSDIFLVITSSYLTKKSEIKKVMYLFCGGIRYEFRYA